MTMQHAASPLRPRIDLAREPDFRLGGLWVRPSACKIEGDGRSVDLQPKVMQVLVILAEARGRVVPREDLLAACWGDVVVGDDSVHRCIARLRRLSEHDFPGAFTVHTQARVGYRLAAGVFDQAAAAGPPPSDAPLGGSDGSRFLRVGRARLGVILVIPIGLVMALLALTMRAPAARSPYTVAVRDFGVVGENPDLGASLADRIAAAVGARQLPVVSRARSSRGDTDGARYVVGGEIRRSGEAVRVDIHIDDARSGLSLWTDSFVRPRADSDALEDQIAGKVADLISLTRTWLGAKADRISPEAVAALLKATDAVRAGNSKILETREAFGRFRDLAPNLSGAHSGFAMATILAAGAQPQPTATQWRAQARAEARRAILLDPGNPEGYLAMGLTTGPDLVERQRWFAKGLAADPEDSSLCNFYGELLLGVGRGVDALPWLNRSLSLDPLSPPKTQSVIRALSVAGRFDEAVAMFPRAERLWPDDPGTLRTIAFSSLIYGPPAAASAALTRLQNSTHPMPADHEVAWRRFESAKTVAAARPDAERRLVALLDTASGDELDAVIAGLASLGDADDAFRVIDPGRAQPRQWSTSTLFEPATASLRNGPRFAAVAQSVGLGRYWAKTGTHPDFCATGGLAAVCRAI